MLTDDVKELEAAKARVAALEAKIAAELNAALAELPAKYGFDDVRLFVAAVKKASDKRPGRKAGSKAPAIKTTKKRTRAKITDATRAEVKKLVEAGKTGGEIAKALKISPPSVQNIKKALGLVKKKK